MKKAKMQFLNVGGVSIIMIFMVLCLTMLGALAVSSAYGDLRLTERYRDNTVRYYEADGRAQNKLFQLHQALNQNSVVQKSELDAVIGSELVGKGENYVGAFLEPMDEKQGIKVVFTLEKRDGEYAIVVESYRVVRITDETYQSTWNLWDGTVPE